MMTGAILILISDRYMLPFGVFLFLGYSRKEEDILGQYTRKTVRDDAVKDLKKVLDKVTQRSQLSISEDQVSLTRKRLLYVDRL